MDSALLLQYPRYNGVICNLLAAFLLPQPHAKQPPRAGGESSVWVDADTSAPRAAQQFSRRNRAGDRIGMVTVPSVQARYTPLHLPRYAWAPSLASPPTRFGRFSALTE